MKSSTTTFVVFLLVFASATTAMPTDGMKGQDTEFFDDLSGFAMDGFDYIAPSIQPLAELLFETASENLTTFNEASNALSAPENRTNAWFSNVRPQHLGYPHQSLRYPHQSLRYPWANTLYPSPSVVHDQPYLYPPQPPATSMASASSCSMLEIGEPYMQRPLSTDGAVPNWIATSYATGDRVQPVQPSVDQMALPQYAQPNVVPYTASVPFADSQVPVATPVPIAQPFEAPNVTTQTPGLLTCGYEGCGHNTFTREEMRHHRRCHVPMALRPYPCPFCHRRFLYPREVERHLPTHGRGRRHYCHVASCPYATKGFGRRDHLTRHVRAKHAADSIIQDSGSSRRGPPSM